MKKMETALRKDIVTRSRELNASGINQGTSGNISVRFEDRMLITPSAIPYEELEPEMIASMPLDEPDKGSWVGPLKPSSEWHFHRRLMLVREDAAAIVHAHPTYCTTLAICRKDIPSCHYMIAAFGGSNVRCSGYATFGTDELSKLAEEAIEGRTACLLANHGMITVGDTLTRAMWRAIELETIARQYYFSLLIGGPVLLSEAAIDETLKGFSSYGVLDRSPSAPARRRRSAAVRTRLPQ